MSDGFRGFPGLEGRTKASCCIVIPVTKLERDIRSAIAVVNSRVQKYPLAFLTESDVQSALFSALTPSYGIPAPLVETFAWGRGQQRKIKPVLSSRLHSEFLLPEGRIDLAILDLNATRYAFSPSGRLGHVQLGPGGHAFIELKVSRTHRSGISCRSVWQKRLSSDITKLARYQWLSFLLAYDFDMFLSRSQVLELRKSAGPLTRLTYLAVKERSFFMGD